MYNSPYMHQYQPLQDRINQYENNIRNPYNQQYQQPQQSDWDLTRTSAQNNTHQTPLNVAQFVKIEDSTAIQDLGNKEVWMGETVYYYNPTTGDLFKKYVDYLANKIVLEVAKFEKVGSQPEIVANVDDPRVDELEETTSVLMTEIEKLKSATAEIEKLKTEITELKKTKKEVPKIEKEPEETPKTTRTRGTK